MPCLSQLNVVAAIVATTLTCSCVVALNSMPVGAVELEPRIVIQRDVRPMPVSLSADGWVDGVYEEKGKQFARGVFIQQMRDVGERYPRGKSDALRVNYPDLYIGDIVPLMGGFYRVLGMSGTGRGASLAFGRLEADEILDSWKCSKATYAFLLGSGGGWLHGARFMATIADRREDEASAKPAVRLKIYPSVWAVNGRAVSRPGSTQIVHVGDLVKLGEAEHRVVSIVRPEMKKQIVGWFEIHQTPEKSSRQTED